jgi:hypothetical protein
MLIERKISAPPKDRDFGGVRGLVIGEIVIAERDRREVMQASNLDGPNHSLRTFRRCEAKTKRGGTRPPRQHH